MSAGVWIGAILLLGVLGAVVYLILRQQERAAKSAKAKTSSRASDASSASRAKARKLADGTVSKAVTKPAPQQSGDYRATSIEPGASACAAVAELSGKRFLVVGEQIPILPLLGCDVSDCSCKYVKHSDRRDPDGDRRALGGQHLDLLRQKGSDERRDAKSGRGRRASDSIDYK